MASALKKIARNFLRKFGLEPVRAGDLTKVYHPPHAPSHDPKELEHLASLGIPVAGMSVLEVGAGVGDHALFYRERGCVMTLTDAWEENLTLLRRMFPDQKVCKLDLNHPGYLEGAPFDVVHCYGVLHHMQNPGGALEYLSGVTRRMLFLAMNVSFGDGDAMNPVDEVQGNAAPANSRPGCRPTRVWVFKRLQQHFQHVYLPKTQPNHREYPVDWTAPEKHAAACPKAVFIASRQPLANEMLVPFLVDRQTRPA